MVAPPLLVGRGLAVRADPSSPCSSMVRASAAMFRVLSSDRPHTGLVYDISTGQVTDLSVSAGPPGLPLQTPPAPAVKRHVDSIEQDHQH